MGQKLNPIFFCILYPTPQLNPYQCECGHICPALYYTAGHFTSQLESQEQERVVPLRTQGPQCSNFCKYLPTTICG